MGSGNPTRASYQWHSPGLSSLWKARFGVSTNPSEKDVRQIESLPQVGGENKQNL